MEYQFTTNWLAQNLGYINMILKSFAPKRILEIGSFEGRSAVHFIEYLWKTHKSGSMTCIDPWTDYWELQGEMYRSLSEAEKKFDHNISLALENTNITFTKMKGSSIKMLSKLVVEESEPFDLVYVDGSHLAVDVFADAALSFHLLNSGGVIIFDDHNIPMGYLGSEYTHPKIAIDAFIKAHDDKIAPILFGTPGDMRRSIPGVGATYQCYLRKL